MGLINVFGAETPSMEQITAAVNNPLWNKLTQHMSAVYSAQPKIEYSICSGAPGWNVKYKKSSRSLCVLYPEKGSFTVLVCIGPAEQQEAELLLTACSKSVQQLYKASGGLNGTRWLMVDIASDEILSDVQKLIATRVKKKR